MRLDFIRNETGALAAVAVLVVLANMLHAVLEWRADVVAEHNRQYLDHVGSDTARVADLRARQQILAAAAAASGGSAQRTAYERAREESSVVYREVRGHAVGQHIEDFTVDAGTLETKLATIELQAITLGAGGDLSAARERLASGDYVALRSLFDQAMQLARADIEGQQAEQLRLSGRRRVQGAVAAGLVTLLLAGAWAWALRGARRRHAAEVELAAALRGTEGAVQGRTAELSAAQDQLQRLNQGLTERYREMELMSQLSRITLASRTLGEVYEGTPRFMERLFPLSAGYVYVINASDSLVEAKGSWGSPRLTKDSFGPEDCWGLRRGQPHVVNDPLVEMVCMHQQALVPPPQSLCIPLTAQNEGLGLLYIEPHTEGNPIETSLRMLAGTAAEQLALGIGNLKMREQLRNQSIRDALTGLYNRRYLEEAAKTEIERSRRKGLPIAVIMLDVDHFKMFNDKHGHEAGDQVLKALAALMRRTVRASDVACRYGGEEFTLLLPEADAEIGMQRAERLRLAMHDVRIDTLPPVTLSFGVAVFPAHGKDLETLLRAADGALYTAKRSGRDRVVLADEPPDEEKQGNDRER